MKWPRAAAAGTLACLGLFTSVLVDDVAWTDSGPILPCFDFLRQTVRVPHDVRQAARYVARESTSFNIARYRLLLFTQEGQGDVPLETRDEPRAPPVSDSMA